MKFVLVPCIFNLESRNARSLFKLMFTMTFDIFSFQIHDHFFYNALFIICTHCNSAFYIFHIILNLMLNSSFKSNTISIRSFVTPPSFAFEPDALTNVPFIISNAYLHLHLPSLLQLLQNDEVLLPLLLI